MNVTVNDEPRNLQSPCTIADLIRECGLAERPCAVEVNRQLVPKAGHADHRLTDGDIVEIVTLVGGG